MDETGLDVLPTSNTTEKTPMVDMATRTEQNPITAVTDQENPSKTQLVDIERVRSAIRKEGSNTPTPQTSENRATEQQPKNWREKIKSSLANAAWGTKIAATSVLQLGGLHPWRSNGEWVWVLEPWARWSDDPKQRLYSSSNDQYFKSFQSHKGRVLNLKSQGYENPAITPDGIGGIQLLDHTRIHEARNAGKGIVVNVNNLRGTPKTYS